MAHSSVSVRDRSADNKMGTLGLFSDLNYTTIGDPYDDGALRRMLGNRLGARGLCAPSLTRLASLGFAARPRTRRLPLRAAPRRASAARRVDQNVWCGC